MEAAPVLLMLFVMVPLVWQLGKDYQKGLALGVALIVALPDSLRLSFGGGIPELTIQRLILITLLATWLTARRSFELHVRVPFLPVLLCLGGAQFISFILSVSHGASLKSFFAFSLEIFAFYVVVAQSLLNRERIVSLLQVLVSALAIVAVVATIERFWGFNLSLFLVYGDGATQQDSVATYPHRILLGYAMAMIVPIILALIEREFDPRKRKLLWTFLVLTIAACYFANSRGPWSGLIFATIAMIVFGSPGIKLRFAAIAMLALLVVAIRPGVRETLISAFESTFQPDSVKGKSYEYRWHLWNVAYSEISKSFERFLFGYGGLSTETMDLGSYFEKESGGTTALLGYTSWDNQLACDLIEFGSVGFAIESVLLLSIFIALVSMWWRSRGVDATLMLAFVASCTVYIYALSNVYVFSPQLKCFFWALVACGLRFGSEATAPSDLAEEADDDIYPLVSVERHDKPSAL